MNPKSILIVANLLIFLTGMGMLFNKKPKEVPRVESHQQIVQSPVSPQGYTINQPHPSFLTYAKTITQLQTWQKEVPDLTEVGTYGKSSRGQDLYYFRICNKRYWSDKPKVLITACIHGNEPLSSSTVMWYIGSLLEKYQNDSQIQKLVDSRDVYFVPVVSPDSYPNNRHVDGVDPNRNFPGPRNPTLRSVAPVSAIQDLFKRIKPNAVISCHTWGRVYLIPYGDKMADSENHADYQKIVGHMAEMSGYRMIRACDMYQHNGLNNPPIRVLGEGWNHIPIHGSEIDWYYRNGAFSIVMEMGTHQKIPTESDIKTEFDRTFQAVLLFIREAPLVKVKEAGW